MCFPNLKFCIFVLIIILLYPYYNMENKYTNFNQCNSPKDDSVENLIITAKLDDRFKLKRNKNGKIIYNPYVMGTSKHRDILPIGKESWHDKFEERCKIFKPITSMELIKYRELWAIEQEKNKLITPEEVELLLTNKFIIIPVSELMWARRLPETEIMNQYMHTPESYSNCDLTVVIDAHPDNKTTIHSQLQGYIDMIQENYPELFNPDSNFFTPDFDTLDKIKSNNKMLTNNNKTNTNNINNNSNTNTTMTNVTPNYEYVKNPNHYNLYDDDVIDMVRKLYGDFAAAMWCEITALKYRFRMGLKPNNPIEQELAKEKVYMDRKNKILNTPEKLQQYKKFKSDIFKL